MRLIFYRTIALLLLILLLPLFVLLYILIKTTSKGSFLFKQQRIGINKKPFEILKVRTMYQDAELDQKKYRLRNEADGPVFKIHEDPRFTKIGKLLARTGLDELPQLVNVLRGEMSFVGPRPLPIREADKIPKKYDKRFSVLPGITSLWVIQGSHKQSFEKWMKLDLDYIQNNNFLSDINISYQTIIIIVKNVFIELLKIISFSKTRD